MAGDRLVKRPRDPRLDFFRGVAMAIILVAHIPTNPWILWIPARFGFSDATETFVFCSGFASALAFGATFTDRGWAMGAARIAHRVWQVYWAHVGVFLVTVAMLAAIDAWGLGARAHAYVAEPYVVPFFERTGEALVGLLTLRYVPGLFDILPMYLVILAMVPAVMALHRIGGGPAVAAAVLATWLAATLAGFAHRAGADPAGWAAPFAPLNLPATPWGTSTWFFNPFGWQLVFFIGFGFGMGWLRPPPASRRLVLLALAVVVLSLPLAWHRLYGGLYLPEGSALAAALAETRERLEPLWWKTWQGGLRTLHFLATAYLAWVAVGEGGRLLREGFTPGRRPVARRRALAAAGAAIALATAPYVYIDAIRAAAPALDAWLLATLPTAGSAGVGWASLAHAAALATLAWNALSDDGRAWLGGPLWRGATEVARKVGTQSLAVFMTSIPLSQLCGLFLDHAGRSAMNVAIANAGGVAVLVGTAYLTGWFKSQPWRGVTAQRTSGAGAGMARTPAE